MKINKKTTIISAALGAALLLPGWALAACTHTSGPGTGNLSFGTVTVQRDTPVGTVLATTSVTSNGATWNCTAIWGYTGTLTLYPTPSPAGNSIHTTNIPGIGIRIIMGGSASSYLPFTLQRAPGGYYQGGTITAYLVKTSASAVGSGNLTNGLLATISADGVITYNINLTGTNRIVPVACSVTNTAITVPMGNLPRNSFSGVGHQSDPVPFFVGLNCDSGTRVNITVDATADSSATPGVIALTSAGSAGVASGVGIQLTYSGTPVTFGSQMPILTSPGGVFNIPLIARYYQTLPTVQAGTANAQATFTMTYN